MHGKREETYLIRTEIRNSFVRIDDVVNTRGESISPRAGIVKILEEKFDSINISASTSKRTGFLLLHPHRYFTVYFAIIFRGKKNIYIQLNYLYKSLKTKKLSIIAKKTFFQSVINFYIINSWKVKVIFKWHRVLFNNEWISNKKSNKVKLILMEDALIPKLSY